MNLKQFCSIKFAFNKPPRVSVMVNYFPRKLSFIIRLHAQYLESTGKPDVDGKKSYNVFEEQNNRFTLHLKLDSQIL